MGHKLICGIVAQGFVLFAAAHAAIAGDQVGTITQLDGDVKVFTQPSRKLQAGPGTHALFEGEYYLVESAKAGTRLELGNIIRTAPGAKARVIYPNGDQMYVGPASALRVFWDKDSAQGKARMELAYGKLRGVVEKGGPRSRLQIKTKTATMGVRGTDFFIADGGRDGGTEISVIRGAVEMKPEAPKAKPVEVKSGFSVSAPTAAAVELRKTTQEELVGIQRSSVIEKTAAPEFAQLEKKAVETTLKDIKATDPKLFAQLEKSGPASVAEINGAAVKELITEAPRAPEKRKPYKSEIEDLEQGAYEKYFKFQE